MYTPEMMENLKQELRDYLYYFGYANCDGQEDTFTTFFKFETAEQKPELVNGYLKNNE
jgi:hypothetical protein